MQAVRGSLTVSCSRNPGGLPMKNREYLHIVHPIPPLYDENSRILILGSFPSVKSREANFFYGHPQNRFWPLMAAIFERPPFRFVEEK